MNKITSLYFLLIILSFSPITNAQSTIQWSKETKLGWSDFKVKPNGEILGYALTSYKIEIQPSDVLVDENNNIENFETLTVVANFYQDHSWVYKKSDYLLTHEQFHFDITGLYAKKMKEEFEKLKKEKIANFDSYLKVYQKLWAQCRKTQKKYDHETNHGQLVEENNSWIHKINVELEKK